MLRYRLMVGVVLVALVAGLIAGCAQPATPQVVTVKETVVVEKEVPVEKEVVKTVVVEKVVTPTPAPKGGELTYGLTLIVSDIDPHSGASSELGIFLTSVYDPLVWRDQEGNFHPGLAKKWEISEDGKVYTFYLRDDVKFHDGTPFNAQAVKFNFDRITNPNFKSNKAKYMMGPYDHTEVVDDYTVKVYFKEPYAPFLDSVSQVYLAIASPKALQEWGDEKYREHQVGTGPFMMAEYVAKDHIVLVKNPDYNWAPEFMMHQGPAYLDKITFRFYPDAATRAPALESGEVQIMGEIPPVDANRLMADPRFVIYPVEIPGQSLQFFINTSKPPTDDLRVRQALLYGLDREAIINGIFRALSPIAHGPLGRKTPGYTSQVEGMYPFDLEKAKQLLADAGWKDTNGDGILDKGGQDLALNTILMTWGYLPEIGTAMQGLYRQLGVKLETQVLTYPAALEAASKNEHHLIPMAISSSDPDILSSYFHSRNIEKGFSWSRFPDPELDQWLDEGARTTDWNKRAELYAKAQVRIMEQALIIPIRDYVNLNGASAKVKGLRYSLQGWFPWLYDVYIEQ
ncbi:MAG: ABC transporter substrate-binding protein [Anaerolineae bacterium]|nr:ABC transporter substrate-binding protein [Anaerolineae bacterium]